MLNSIVQGEAEKKIEVAHMDHPGGPLDRGGIELEEPGKGHCFEKYWNSQTGRE